MKKTTVTVLAIVLTVAAVGQIVMSFVLYDREGDPWLRNAGWGILTVSGIFGWLPIYAFRTKGGVSKGRGYVHTTVLVDSGIYGIVRHPQYLAGVLMSLALAMIAQHWIVTALGGIAAVVYYTSAVSEEKSCVEKFGESYQRYMESVPRMNFVVGLLRWLRRREST